jgi:uncharacterized membrane protein YoaK (UPF0700 family)
MERKNYGSIPLLLASWPVLLILILGIPILLFGLGAVIGFFRFMFSPIASGSIPVSALMIIGIIILLLFRKRRRQY